MKTFSKMAAQGDFVIVRVADIPENLIPAEPENNQIIIAHSETGHNHVMERTHVEAFIDPKIKEIDLYEMFLSVKEATPITHLRSHDTHEPIMVPPGKYMIRRQDRKSTRLNSSH